MANMIGHQDIEEFRKRAQRRSDLVAELTQLKARALHAQEWVASKLFEHNGRKLVVTVRIFETKKKMKDGGPGIQTRYQIDGKNRGFNAVVLNLMNL